LNQFSRRVGVEFYGDNTSLLASNAENISAIKEFGDISAATQRKLTETTLLGTTKRIQATRASVAEFQLASDSFVKGSDAQIAAAYQLGIAQKRLAVLTGETAVESAAFSSRAKTTERDFGKTTRGILAGSGAFTSLGRSLAFASGGFLLFASGAAAIRGSIKAAQAEVVAQKQVARQLQTSGKSWQQYGTQIDAALLKESHLAGFTKADLLTAFGFLVRIGGNVSKSLKLTGLAADIARARTISLSSASLALAKALGGSATALRRLGIIVPKHVTTTQALAFVTAKFAGQAQAGTTATEKFRATLTDAGSTIGRSLLPAVNRLATSLSNWLAKMNESGRLQKDINEITLVSGKLFHALGVVIGQVDKVTGSFANTLKILLGVYGVSKIVAVSTAVKGLATSWGLVAKSAGEAAAAETAALGAGGAGGAAAGASRQFAVNSAGVATQFTAAGEGAAAGGLASRLRGLAPKAGELAPLTIPAILLLTDTKVTANAKKELHDFIHGSVGDGLKSGLSAGLAAAKRLGFITANNIISPVGGVLPIAGLKAFFAGRPSAAPPLIGPINQFGAGGIPSAFQSGFPLTPGRGGGRGGGAAQPVTQWATFQLRIADQVAQAQASLTKTTADDVAAAKRIIAHIKQVIAAGHLKGAALVTAIQAEAGAVSTIQSIAQAAAAKRQAAAAKALAAASSYNVPAALQLAQAKLQAFGKDQTQILHEIIASAEKAIKSGHKNTQGLIAAYNAISAARSQLAQNTIQDFQTSARLTLDLAREQAFGLSTTATLEKMKKAILKWLHSAKRTIAQQTDAYNQLAAINSQLGQTVGQALGGFRQASTRALTAGLGLTDAQRRALRARLSQLGPGGTIPGSGVGAAGFVIGTDGRPLIVHTHVNIDGKRVANNVTRHQQRHRRRNPHQRRGPNAGG
jgi:aerobic-type carbon monoxide dehydrogenase small subunit (CoxS/CutS family)